MGRVLPIIFGTEMVQAILNGRKTVTRRVIKFPVNRFTNKIPDADKVSVYSNTLHSERISFQEEPFYCFDVKPPYREEDTLYVREAWGYGYYGGYIYKADDKLARLPAFKSSTKLIYRPSIHMPKEVARIWLKVTEVRVERLQEITEEQAEKEGIPDSLSYPINPVYCPICHGNGFVGGYNPDSLGYEDEECLDCNTFVKRFRNFWNSAIKKSNLGFYGWDANPFVWVIGFERCEKPGSQEARKRGIT